MTTRFRIGQKVRIVSDIKVLDPRATEWYIVDEMMPFAGKLCTIASVFYFSEGNEYFLEECPDYVWEEIFLVPVKKRKKKVHEV